MLRATNDLLQSIVDLSEQVLGRVLLADGVDTATPRQIARELRFNEQARVRNSLPIHGIDLIQGCMAYLVPQSER